MKIGLFAPICIKIKGYDFFLKTQQFFCCLLVRIPIDLIKNAETTFLNLIFLLFISVIFLIFTAHNLWSFYFEFFREYIFKLDS